MNPITYCLVKDAAGALVAPADAGFDPGKTPSPSAWRELARRIAQEPGLTPFPAEALAWRWEHGYSAVLLDEGEIQAHASCLPVFAGPERDRLAQILPGVPWWPQTDVYEFLTGWTHPGMRRLGVSMRLRQQLLQRFITPGCLAVGVTVGMGASPVLYRLGWSMASWCNLPYLSSLFQSAGEVCVPDRQVAWHVTGHQPYNGEPVSPFEANAFGESHHPWGQYSHLWVSNLALAQKLDRQLRAAVPCDLCDWRMLWQEVIDDVLLAQGWLPIVFED